MVLWLVAQVSIASGTAYAGGARLCLDVLWNSFLRQDLKWQDRRLGFQFSLLTRNQHRRDHVNLIVDGIAYNGSLKFATDTTLEKLRTDAKIPQVLVHLRAAEPEVDAISAFIGEHPGEWNTNCAKTSASVVQRFTGLWIPWWARVEPVSFRRWLYFLKHSGLDYGRIESFEFLGTTEKEVFLK